MLQLRYSPTVSQHALRVADTGDAALAPLHCLCRPAPLGTVLGQSAAVLILVPFSLDQEHQKHVSEEGQLALRRSGKGV